MERVNKWKNDDVKNIGLAAMFIAIGMVLPFFTGQIPQIGNMLLPMHIPVFICSYLCNWKYGTLVGATLPLLRSLIFGVPVLYPNAIAMMLELAVYGLVSGYVYGRAKKKSLKNIYISLVLAMLCGRVVWGAAQMVLLGMAGNAFTWKMFVTASVINAIPGIFIQLLIIPAIVTRLKTKEIENN